MRGKVLKKVCGETCANGRGGDIDERKKCLSIHFFM